MALELARALAATERDDNLHMARLLLLMAAHAGDKGRPIEGLTKLAKLDFLLRYPNCLERALTSAGKDPGKAEVAEFERTTIESKMVRFRYGPWDHRYRRWVALMSARGLVAVDVKGKTVQLWPTTEGQAMAAALADQEPLEDLATRAKLVAKSFGNRSGTDLKNFMYATFPELTDMKWGEEIAI
ncbi:hypothetical protein [Variovorax atrisoli]|uniref:hypothetical protein n=1 Tax=Variovorax atrisoli TaxID=3394203 RepID=UPI003395C591